MSLTRRNFLNTGAACTLGGAAGFANDLMRFNAFAADTSGYRAIICVFLFGGMDSYDAVIPYDTHNYNQYANIRRELLNRYDSNDGGSTRDRDRLLPLNLANASAFGGRQFALPPELGPLHELINRGDGAIVSNVGPLVVPMNRDDYNNGTAPRPPRLFSHNDQQSVWMSSQPEGAQLGWGGRLSDMAVSSLGNSNATFTTVSTAGSTVFLQGEIVGQYEVGSSGPQEIRGVGDNAMFGSDSLPSIYEAHLRAEGQSLNNLFQRDFVNVMNRSIDANRELRESFGGAAPFSTVFPETGLGRQLQIVARIIALRSSLGVSRQVFFVGTGGFDTHSDQHRNMPRLQTDIALSMRAFYDATAAMGVDRDVTSFTASDFGRTLTINRDGTDHGWGAHHFVIGGGVNGARIVGDFPEPVLDHQFDSGNGRLIPSISVDQFASTLGGWFGLNSSERHDALPGLSNFTQTDIGLF
ncbi:DUF1501 domain-containing protein [Hyphococcus sp.]|uniref:DUF1501 domain-containing protein n=1 Tax=Hyphococcus sp. TaxID=2038636 RepID=UPI003CCC4167